MGHLKVLSKYCRAVLTKADVLIFPEGIAPKDENFARWTIGRDVLRFTFDSYQVAPYAAGPQFCNVPASALRRVLTTPTRLA